MDVIVDQALIAAAVPLIATGWRVIVYLIALTLRRTQ